VRKPGRCPACLRTSQCRTLLYQEVAWTPLVQIVVQDRSSAYTRKYQHATLADSSEFYAASRCKYWVGVHSARESRKLNMKAHLMPSSMHTGSSWHACPLQDQSPRTTQAPRTPAIVHLMQGMTPSASHLSAAIRNVRGKAPTSAFLRRHLSAAIRNVRGKAPTSAFLRRDHASSAFPRAVRVVPPPAPPAAEHR